MTETAAGPSARPPDAEHSAPVGRLRASFDRLERALVFTSARVGEHPIIGLAAELTLRAQIRATRSLRRASSLCWHTCGMATFDEINMLDEQLWSIRHRRKTRAGDGAEAGPR